LARLATGDATVGELAAPFAMTMPAISKHLSVLERAGLITKSRDGQRRNCRITATPLRNATQWLDEYRRHWEANLDSLDDYLTRIQQQEEPT
jgi:DNA-binding transcriptional ArsR family regulator